MNGLLLCGACHWVAEEQQKLFEEWLKVACQEHYAWVREYRHKPGGTVLVSEIKEIKAELRQALRKLT
jgi:hypothetical protein